MWSETNSPKVRVYMTATEPPPQGEVETTRQLALALVLGAVVFVLVFAVGVTAVVISFRLILASPPKAGEEGSEGVRQGYPQATGLGETDWCRTSTGPPDLVLRGPRPDRGRV